MSQKSYLFGWTMENMTSSSSRVYSPNTGLVSSFIIYEKLFNKHILIARKSALEKTQLSDVLITDNLF